MRNRQRYVVEVPMPPNVANQAGGASNVARHHVKKRYFRQLDDRQNCGLIPRPPTRPFARCNVTAVMHLGHRMDSENAKYRAYKWPMDWLKTRGYVADDGPNCVTMHDPEQIIKRGGTYRVVLTLVGDD